MADGTILTAEELAAIRDLLKVVNEHPWDVKGEWGADAVAGLIMDDLPNLLATVEGLRTEHEFLQQRYDEYRKAAVAQLDYCRAENTTLRMMLRQVLDTADEAGRLVRCPFCGTKMDLHADDCRREHARALLGSERSNG